MRLNSKYQAHTFHYFPSVERSFTEKIVYYINLCVCVCTTDPLTVLSPQRAHKCQMHHLFNEYLLRTYLRQAWEKVKMKNVAALSLKISKSAKHQIIGILEV